MYSKLTEYMNKYAGAERRRSGEAARRRGGEAARRRGGEAARDGIKESKRRRRGEEREKVHAEDSILLIRSIYRPDTVYPRIHVAAFTLIRSFLRPPAAMARDHPFPVATSRDIIRDETPVACTTCFRLHVSLALARCAFSCPSDSPFLPVRRGVYREWNMDGRYGRFVEACFSRVIVLSIDRRDANLIKKRSPLDWRTLPLLKRSSVETRLETTPRRVVHRVCAIVRIIISRARTRTRVGIAGN